MSGIYYIFTDRNRTFKRVSSGALAFNTFRNSDGALESIMPSGCSGTPKPAAVDGSSQKSTTRTSSRRSRLAARSRFRRACTTSRTSRSERPCRPSTTFRADVDFRSGTYFDGTRTRAILTPTWNVSRYLELGGDYQLSLLRFDTRHQHANIQLARFRIRTALNARASANAFVQYNSTTDRVDLNLRLRYAFAREQDLWMVWRD